MIPGLLSQWRVAVALAVALSGFNSAAEAIHELVKRGDVAGLTELLETNRSALALMDTNGNIPLHLAAWEGRVPVVELLLDKGAAITATNRDEGLSPLHMAARRGKFAAVRLLVNRGADVNARDTHGCRPLHSAAFGARGRIARFLLDHGAEVNAARSDGTTPLVYAAMGGNTNLVALLLERGANADVRDENGATPLHVATFEGQLSVVERLVAAGAEVNAKDNQGLTALHVAAKAGRSDIAAWLLEHGADADAPDRLHFKPVDYVTGADNYPLAELLRRHMKSRVEQSLSAKVGEVGDPDHLQFSGLETFTAEQIRRALARKPTYLIASHPQAEMSAYLEALKEMLESGFQATGFPDARVEVRYDESEWIVRVKVTEGPRFRSAGIHVAGASRDLEEELIHWFTTGKDDSESSPRPGNVSASAKLKTSDPDVSMSVKATAGVNVKRNAGSLKTPGKEEKPDQPTWRTGKPANFSVAYRTQAVEQVEACLAEQGFFFPEAGVELLPNATNGTADLYINLLNEGPPGVIGEIDVTGCERHSPDDLLDFLGLHEGMSINAGLLDEARRKLNGCGRFVDYHLEPKHTGLDVPSSRRVDLQLEVEELKDVPLLGEPLPPEQEALLRLCDWLEAFPSRDEDIQLNISNSLKFPFGLELVLSPRNGMMLDVFNLNRDFHEATGFLLDDDTIQLCSWGSGRRLAAPRAGRGEIFVHFVPAADGGTNRFTMALGGGYRRPPGDEPVPENPVQFDVQLLRAAFLDLADDAFITDGVLVLSNSNVFLRADAASGRPTELSLADTNSSLSVRFGGHEWERVRGEFEHRAAALTNLYAPDRRLSTLITFVATEVARHGLAQRLVPDQHLRALSAVNKLLNADLLHSLDQMFVDDETDTYFVPFDQLDAVMAQRSLATLYAGFAFEWSGVLFPKYSWPWTAARESAFVMMSQGRYVGAELDRLYDSEDTGPIGCLFLSYLLSAAGSPAVKPFALGGLTRLGATDFLRDCNLFLRGESGLARSFSRVAAALRDLPDEELEALVALLPEPEGTLVRESAAALRADPDAPPAISLEPALRKYWEDSLRAKVREALHEILSPPRDKSDQRAATVRPEDLNRTSDWHEGG